MPTEPGAQKAPQKNYVDTKIIATLFGLTARRIQQLTQDGILKTEQVGRQRRYDLLDTVRRYIAYLQEKCNSKGGSKDDTENESRKIKAPSGFTSLPQWAQIKPLSFFKNRFVSILLHGQKTPHAAAFFACFIFSLQAPALP